MGLLSRFAGWRKKDTSPDNPAAWFRDWALGGSKSSAGIAVSPLRAMQDMAFMACIAIRAGDLAKCPLHLFRRQGDGEEVVATGHWLERLLQKPNNWQDGLEFIEQMQAGLLLRSNAYAGVLRDGRGVPVELIPFWPDRVAPLVASDGSLYFQIRTQNLHESIQLARFPVHPIPAGDMLHVRWLSFDGLQGLSRIHLMREALGLSLALGEHSARLFSNGARPGGVLETANRLSDPVYERFKAQWENFYSGVENSGKTPILEEGLQWKPQTMTSVESQTIEGRRFQREEIALACEVPLHRLGVIQDRDSAILQAQQMYLNNTLSTDAERWERKVNNFFGLDGREFFVAFDLDYFNRADIQTRMTAYRTGVVGMILTPNEARLYEGKKRIAGGDTLYQPTNVAPIGFMPQGSQSGPGSDVTGAPAPGGDGDPSAAPLN